MHSPLVSILLPVYNGEKTIKGTLESLLNQTFTNFELLIGIDGTKDASKDIALAFKDPRIKIFEHPKNLGLANNLNEIIKQVSPQSQFFAMAEQDDIYVPERLAWQVEVMQKYDDVGLVSGVALFKGNKKDIRFPGILRQGNQFPIGEELFKYLYVNQLKVVNTCMLWRRSVHEGNKFIFSNTYGNFNIDWDFILRFSLKSRIYGIKEILVHMNRNTIRESVTVNRDGQLYATERLLKDFKKEYPALINHKLYLKALKVHKKNVLGNTGKFKMVITGVLYSFLYFDLYFLKYILFRTRKYLNNKL